MNPDTFRTALVAVVLLLNMSCVTAAVPPRRTAVVNTHVFDAPFDDVWTAVVATVAEQNLPIGTLEKNSGIVVITQAPYAAGDADEGTLGSSVGMGIADVVVHRQANFNIQATRVGQDRTQIRVNTALRMEVRGGNGSQMFPYSSEWREVYSNGNIEKRVIDGIAARLRP